MEIGAQLFTIRDYCKNLADFEESLKKIADIGDRLSKWDAAGAMSISKITVVRSAIYQRRGLTAFAIILCRFSTGHAPT